MSKQLILMCNDKKDEFPKFDEKEFPKISKLAFFGQNSQFSSKKVIFTFILAKTVLHNLKSKDFKTKINSEAHKKTRIPRI